MNSKKCPRQTIFVKHLDELLSSYFDAFRDRCSVDSQDNYIKKFSITKKHFVDLWCPTAKEYEEF